MVGAMFRLGEQKVRPGVYARWYNAGDSPYAGTIGIAAAVVKSNWGPLNEVISIDDEESVKKTIGTGYGPDVIQEVFRGGAYTVLAVRVGRGGEPASLTLKSAMDTDVAKIQTKYPTSRNFVVTIRESLNIDEKEFLVYEDDRQIEKIVFKADENEVGNFVFAVNESSAYFKATDLEAPEKKLALVLNDEVTGGSDPVITSEDYTDAFGVIEKKFFDGIVVDTEDTVIHKSLQAFVNRRLREGARIIGVVGEKISIPFSTRKENSRSFNDFAMIYVGNGYETPTGGIDGARASGRVLGMMVSGNYKTSLTKKTVRGSIGVYGELTSSQYSEAVESGMLVFSENIDGIAQVDYGINTLVSVSSDEDEGWKKIRRVRTRFELIDRIAFTLDRQIGDGEGIGNGNDGRQHVITVGNGIIGDMIREGGLESGEMAIDEQNPAHGDSAWFTFNDLVDLDGMEKIYLAFGFKY